MLGCALEFERLTQLDDGLMLEVYAQASRIAS